MRRIALLGWIVGVGLLVAGCSLGSQQAPLGNWQPALSPDGTTVAFASPGEKGFEIFTLRIATGERHQLTENTVDDWSPSWSPEGDRLIMASNREKNVDLYVLEVATLTATRLTSDAGDDVNPTWGSNGKILFDSNRSGSWEIYMIDPNGENLTKVTGSAG